MTRQETISAMNAKIGNFLENDPEMKALYKNINVTDGLAFAVALENENNPADISIVAANKSLGGYFAIQQFVTMKLGN